MNHAFVDGNERVAFALTAIFLRTNRHRLVVSADPGVRTSPVADLHILELDTWWRENREEGPGLVRTPSTCAAIASRAR